MNKRQIILALIRAEVAENGEMTSRAMRLYTDNNISLSVFDGLVDEGMQRYNQMKAGVNELSPRFDGEGE